MLNVFFYLFVNVTFRNSKVNYMNLMDLVGFSIVRMSHKKVFRFDISMDIGFLVNAFKNSNELMHQDQRCLQRELLSTDIE